MRYYSKYYIIGIFLLLFTTVKAQFVINGSAVHSGGGDYLLTPAQGAQVGSIWYQEKISLEESFELNFELYFGNKDNGADGLAFCLQPLSTNIGVSGGGLGVQGVNPSFFAEFDTYRNGGEPSFDHVALQRNGDVNNLGSNNLATAVQIKAGQNNVENGQWYPMRAVWDANTKKFELYVDCVLRVAYTGDIVNQIFGGDPMVFWGFTAATGGANNEHRVRNIRSTLIKIEDQTICRGESAPITIPPTSSSFTWSPTIGIDNLTSLTPNFSPTQTTEYVISYDGFCNTQLKDTVVITVDNCGCDDNDNDGVCDEDDLDDDNDGILDVVECPNTYVSTAFQTNGGTATTFLAPSADGGFRFDVFSLDNSFNLTVNGVNLVPNEIQCQGGGAAGESLLVFSSDNSGFGQNGNDNIWVINGDSEEPVIRVNVGPNGEVFFEGKRNSGMGLEAMRILANDPQPANITWNSAGNNVVVLSQRVVGPTNISGEGNGVVSCDLDTDGDGILNYLDTDSDNDGCPDALEGDAGFKLSDLNGEYLSGAVDANGVPVVALGGQAKGSSDNDLIVADVCNVCDVDKPAVNGVTGEPFDDFYFDSFNPLNETINGLSAGEKYQIKVTGTWSVWSNDPTKNVLDAAYRYKEKNASADITPVKGVYWKLNGGSSLRPIPDVYNTNHEYIFEPTATGNGEVFTWSDSNYGDNSGGLNFQFYKLFDTIRVCQSATTTLLSDFVEGQNLKWYTSETSTNGTTNVPEIDNNTVGLTGYWVTQTIDGCESDKAFIYYRVKAKPVVNLGNDSTICLGESIIIDAGNTGIAYAWNSGEISQSIEVSNGGTYEVIVTNSNDCETTESVIIDVKACIIDHFENDTVYVCEGDSIEIIAKEVTTQVWGGDGDFTQINDSTIKVSPSSNTLYYVGESNGYTVGDNIIINGDFESGNTGFTSDYIYKTTGMQRGGYAIGTSANNYNGVFSACGDNTSGTGNMFITDASEQANVKVWCQHISTIANTKYEFAAHVTSVYKPNPPILQFSVNGIALGASFSVEETVCNWQKFAATWDSDATTSAEICLVNQNTAGSGNDFAIDDISFAPVQPISSGGDSILVVVRDTTVINLGDDVTICAGEETTFITGLSGVHIWNTGSTEAQITVSDSGNYSVTYTNGNGCISEATIQLAVNDLPIVNLGNDTTICIGETVDLNAQNAGLNYIWNNGSKGQSISIETAGVYGVKVTDDIGCLGSDSMELFVNDLPVVDLGIDQKICDGTNIELNAQNEDLNYNWSNGLITQTISVNESGIYSVEVTDEIGCLGTGEMELIVNPMPIVNLGNDTAICIGESVTLNAQNPGYNYDWNTGETKQDITITGTGEYRVRVYDEIGCADSSSMMLRVNELPVVALGNDTVICEYQSVVLDAENSRFNFVWNTGGNSQTIDVSEEGLYSVEVRDEIGCLGTDEIYVTKEIIEDPYLEKDHIICEGTSILLEPDFYNGYTIFWEADYSSSTIEVTETGAYASYVHSEYCKDTFVVNVTKIDTPDASVIDLRDEGKYCFDIESTTLRVISEDQDDEFNWDDFGRTSEVEITEGGVYGITVSNEYCESRYEKEVKEYCPGIFFVPNAFTPADDNGLNEQFLPISNGHVDGFDFRIYNRWGVLIFQTNKLGEGWNGILSGNMVQCDVYVYRIAYNYASESGGIERKEQVGTVTLLK